jgi:transcriptional antiterminator RfaH
MIVEGRSWHVVQTHVRAENQAACHLRRQGFEIYLPLYLKRRRHARKVEMVPAPLFPRYLFIALDRTTQQWRKIRSTYGVSHLVCHGDEPATMPGRVISELRAREDDRGFIELDCAPAFAPGDSVRVLDGVLNTFTGLFERMADHERVAILLDLLGRKVRVVLDLDSIVAA